jgi:hypothetical protein
MRHDNSPVLKKKESKVAKRKKKVVRRLWAKADLKLLKAMARDKKGANKGLGWSNNVRVAALSSPEQLGSEPA